MTRTTNRILGALAALTLGWTGALQAETTVCDQTIGAVPYVIGKPGVYCMVSSLSYNGGNAISIESSDVVLDLNGYVLSGQAGATGVHAEKPVANVTVKNGTIRGFNQGVLFFEAAGSLVEDLRLEENAVAGISLMGSANTVRRCYVLDAGKGQGSSWNAHGIHLTGPGSRVLDNDVVRSTAEAGLLAIWIDSNGPLTGRGAVVEGNRVAIENVAQPGPFPGGPSTYTQGIVTTADTQDNLIVDNRLARLAYGIIVGSNATAKYRDTLTIGVSTPYTGGTSAGNNN